MAEPDHIVAHRYSSNHRAQLADSERCGCFHCCHTFSPEKIEEWVNDEGTALCPFCGIDSVIGSASGFPITDGFLTKMKAYWFATPEILYRVVDQVELDRIRESGWRRFPAPESGQNMFSALLSEDEAFRRARDSLTEHSMLGNIAYVVGFCISASFLQRFEADRVGRHPSQYLIPEHDLDGFNDHILDVIQLIGEVR